MRDMLQEVVRRGTAAGVRARGLNVPAAGKTGTSRDGWFAGFTSNLICVVWVGFDDNSDLNLEGARSALPIWTEFMMRATQNADYAHPFEGAPDGVIFLQIDPETGETAGPSCPSSRGEYFIAGSQPQGFCSRHAGAVPVAITDDVVPSFEHLEPHRTLTVGENRKVLHELSNTFDRFALGTSVVCVADLG